MTETDEKEIKETDDIEPSEGSGSEEKEEQSPDLGDTLSMDDEEAPEEDTEKEENEEEKSEDDDKDELERDQDQDDSNEDLEEEPNEDENDLEENTDKVDEPKEIDVEKDHARFSGEKEKKAKEDFFKKQQEEHRKELIKQQYREQELLNKQEAMLNSGTEPFENRLERTPLESQSAQFNPLNKPHGDSVENLLEDNVEDVPEASNPIEYEQRRLSEKLNKEIKKNPNGREGFKEQRLNNSYFDQPSREFRQNVESPTELNRDAFSEIDTATASDPIEYERQQLAKKINNNIDKKAVKQEHVAKADNKFLNEERVRERAFPQAQQEAFSNLNKELSNDAFSTATKEQPSDALSYERQRLSDKINERLSNNHTGNKQVVKNADKNIIQGNTGLKNQQAQNTNIGRTGIDSHQNFSNEAFSQKETFIDNKTDSNFSGLKTDVSKVANKQKYSSEAIQHVAEKEQELLNKINKNIANVKRNISPENIAKKQVEGIPNNHPNITDNKPNINSGISSKNDFSSGAFSQSDNGAITQQQNFDRSGLMKKVNVPIDNKQVINNQRQIAQPNKQIVKNSFLEQQKSIDEQKAKKLKDAIANITKNNMPGISSINEKNSIGQSSGIINAPGPKENVEYLKSSGRFIEKRADGTMRYISQKEYDAGIAKKLKPSQEKSVLQPEKKKLVKIGGGEVNVDAGQQLSTEKRTLVKDKISTGAIGDKDKVLTGKDSLIGAQREGSLARADKEASKMKQFLARRGNVTPSQNIFSPQGIANGGKAIVQSIGKKALTAGLATSVTMGGIFGGTALYQGRIRSNNTHIVQPVQAVNKSSADKDENMMQEMANMLQERLKAYYKILKGETLTEEEKKKAGSEYVPLQDITITKATLDGSEIDAGSITMSNLKNFSAEYNLSGNKTDKNGSIFSGLFKKNIGVSAVIPTYDFVDGEGNTIGNDKFLLSPESDIVFPNGTAGKAVKTNTTIQNTSGDSSAKLGSETQMDIMLNMLGAMETGGQVYGQRDYSNVINAEAGGEVASTIGWSSLYGNNARNYLTRFRSENQSKFSELDSNGIIAPLLEKDWEADRIELNAEQTEVVKKILTSSEGKKLQDRIAAERVVKHWNYCANTYTTNLRAVFWYTQLAELGGGDYASSPVDAVFQACNGDYSTENILKNLKKRNEGSQIGASLYNSRHAKYKEWIDEKIPENMEVDLANVEVTGAGAIDVVQAGTSGTSSSSGAGQLLFVKEILSMGAVAGYSGDPKDNYHFQKYCVTLADYAIAGHGQGITVELRTTASGQKESWTDEEGNKVEVNGKKIVATVKIPVLCDLAKLEENDKMFNYSWDLSNKTYGDKLVQSYIALRSSDFEKVFNVKIKALSFGYVGGNANPEWADGFGGISNLPYVKWAREIAADDSHGYSWVHRLGNPDYDCSSLVYYALTQAGFNVGPPAFSTYSQVNLMTEAGFVQYEITSPDDLRPGDILWRQEHTEIYIGGGRTVGAHIDEVGGVQGAIGGDQTGEEISEGPTDWSGWTYGFHPPAGYNPTE